MDQFKKINWKNRQNEIILGAFAVAFLAAVLIGALPFYQPIVTITIIMLLQVGVAVCLHHAELWFHGTVMIVELIVGVLLPRISTAVIGVILYAATICALKYIFDESTTSK